MRKLICWLGLHKWRFRWSAGKSHLYHTRRCDYCDIEQILCNHVTWHDLSVFEWRNWWELEDFKAAKVLEEA